MYLIVDFVDSGSDTLDNVFPKEGDHVKTKEPSIVSAKTDNIDSSDTDGSSHEPSKSKTQFKMQPKRRIVKEKNSNMSMAEMPIPRPKKRKKKSRRKQGMTSTFDACV